MGNARNQVGDTMKTPWADANRAQKIGKIGISVAEVAGAIAVPAMLGYAGAYAGGWLAEAAFEYFDGTTVFSSVSDLLDDRYVFMRTHSLAAPSERGELLEAAAAADIALDATAPGVTQDALQLFSDQEYADAYVNERTPLRVGEDRMEANRAEFTFRRQEQTDSRERSREGFKSAGRFLGRTVGIVGGIVTDSWAVQ